MKYKLLVNYIENNQDQFYRVAYSYTKSKEDSLDIVQDAILKALKSYKSIREINYMKTWFYRILMNTCMSHFRKNKPLMLLDMEVQHEDKSYMDLYDALDFLSDLDKSIIILRYFEDLKFKEIAEVLNLNLNTIKTKHTKILKKLKKYLIEEVDYV